MQKWLGIPVIADEVYGHVTFGSNLFVPMGVFGSIVPVFTLGSISKRWLVPGWWLGWIVFTDPNGFLIEAKIPGSIKQYLNMSNNLASIIQVCICACLDSWFHKEIPQDGVCWYKRRMEGMVLSTRFKWWLPCVILIDEHKLIINFLLPVTIAIIIWRILDGFGGIFSNLINEFLEM